MNKVTFRVLAPLGLHLRSFCYVVEVGVKYFPEVVKGRVGSHVVAVNLETGEDADAKSPLQLGSLNATFGTRLQFISMMEEKLWDDYVKMLSLLFYENTDHAIMFRSLDKIFENKEIRGVIDRALAIERLQTESAKDGALRFFERLESDDNEKFPVTRVFISFKSEDHEHANKVFDHLTLHGIDAFWAPVSIPLIGSADFYRTIEQNLAECDHMVLVTSCIEHIESGYVWLEWTTFANEIHSGRKCGNLVTVLAGGMTTDKLPVTLRRYQSENLTYQGLDNLINYILTKKSS